MTQPCVFCGKASFDKFEGKEEGASGRRIGELIICDSCLSALKKALGIDKLENALQLKVFSFT
jgi:hypothetical protein